MMDDDTEAYEDQGPEEPSPLDTEAAATCPHCGATVSLTLAPSAVRAPGFLSACRGGRTRTAPPRSPRMRGLALPGCAAVFVASAPWNVATAASGAPARAMSSTTAPPKQ